MMRLIYEWDGNPDDWHRNMHEITPIFNQLAWLIAWENFIKLICLEINTIYGMIVGVRSVKVKCISVVESTWSSHYVNNTFKCGLAMLLKQSPPICIVLEDQEVWGNECWSLFVFVRSVSRRLLVFIQHLKYSWWRRNKAANCVWYRVLHIFHVYFQLSWCWLHAHFMYQSLASHH